MSFCPASVRQRFTALVVLVAGAAGCISNRDQPAGAFACSAGGPCDAAVAETDGPADDAGFAEAGAAEVGVDAVWADARARVDAGGTCGPMGLHCDADEDCVGDYCRKRCGADPSVCADEPLTMVCSGTHCECVHPCGQCPPTFHCDQVVGCCTE